MTPRRIRLTALAVASLWMAFSSAQAAELQLATLFSDHMVLQREKVVPVWGWATAGESVQVQFAGQSKTAVADADGKWMVRLDPMPANAQSQTLTVRGSKSIEIRDVLVGEVWLGSGQSNMAMSVSRARDYSDEQKRSDLPLVRMFKEGSSSAASPQSLGKGTWELCSPTTVGGFSATLFFFGREIHQQLNVPVGLINSSVGGTPIEAWIDAESQRQVAALEPFFQATDAIKAKFDAKAAAAKYQKDLARWEKAAKEARQAKKTVPARPRDPVELQARKGDIGGLYNGKIAPLVPYSLRGVVWYQGEANAQPGKCQFYQTQLELLVSDWRAKWHEDIPFAWVQLPNFGREGDYWMVVREAMLNALRLPSTGMAITIDIGEEKDIHPKNKQDVGKRLALWALGEVYHRELPAESGPIPINHQVSGREIVVQFSYADGGLRPRDGEVKGFVIAADDQKWKPAAVRIEGDRVIASHPEIAAPAALRYNWAPMPDGNLVNGVGLPASPFRTDHWKLDVGSMLSP